MMAMARPIPRPAPETYTVLPASMPPSAIVLSLAQQPQKSGRGVDPSRRR